MEANHDENGIVWPVSIAPYEAVVTVVKADDEATMAAAEEIYQGLLEAGVDVIIDDRDERPGVKFADAELIGFPYRITVGPRGLAEGEVEVMRRKGQEKESRCGRRRRGHGGRRRSPPSAGPVSERRSLPMVSMASHNLPGAGALGYVPFESFDLQIGAA